MPRKPRFAAGLLSAMLLCEGASTVDAAMILRNLGNTVVQGAWAMQPDDTYAIESKFYDLDLNGDQQLDLRFEHHFQPPTLYVPRDVGEQLVAAREGLLDVDRRLEELRSVAIASASSGVNNELSYAQNHARMQSLLEYVDRVAQMTWEGRPLLNGQVGRVGTSSDPELLDVSRVAKTTLENNYLIRIDPSAKRATISAGTSQTAALAQDEILSINGVHVQLFSGMVQDAVIDQINKYSVQTGVRALNDRGINRLYSNAWGSAGEVTVISNQAAAADSSGFGNYSTTDSGTDIVVEVNGNVFEGRGNVVEINSGEAKGLVLRAVEDFADPTVTRWGDVNVQVTDQSLQTLLRPTELGQTLTIEFPNVQTRALGIESDANRFPALSDIRVVNPREAQEALEVIEHAQQEVQNAIVEIDTQYGLYYAAQGQASVTSLDVSGETELALQLRPLSEGTLVDENTPFTSGPLELAMTPETEGTGRFLGFRLFTGLESHYGWIRLELGADNSVVLKQLVYEAEPGRGIRVGYVPEPASHHASLVGIAGLLSAARRRRSAFSS